MSREVTLEEIRKQAEESWTSCHHCDQYDKEMWINGFVTGYLTGQTDIQIVAKPICQPVKENGGI